MENEEIKNESINTTVNESQVSEVHDEAQTTGTESEASETTRDTFSGGPIPRKAPGYLEQFAKDLVNGNVFTDRHVQSAKELMQTFIPVAFMSKESKRHWKDELGMMYEYMDEAVGVHPDTGLPLFTSFQLLHKDDLGELQTHVDEYIAYLESNDLIEKEEDGGEIERPEGKPIAEEPTGEPEAEE
jgi:hypothetical protein